MYRLLIVDDEQIIVDGLAEILEAAELPLKEIKRAYTAKEAIEAFEKSPFDIVLADIKMPRTDGLTMAGILREISSSVKIVFLSGYSDFDYARQAVKIGAYDYLLKPVDDDIVIETIKKVTDVLEEEYNRLIEFDRAKVQLSKTKNLLKSDFFVKLFDNIIKPHELTLEENFDYFGIEFDNKKPVTACVLFRIDEYSEQFEEDDETLVQFAVTNIINEILEDNCYIESFQADKSIAVLIIQNKEEITADIVQYLLQRKLEEAQDTIYRSLGVVVSIELYREDISWESFSDTLNMLVMNMKLHYAKGMLLVNDTNEILRNNPEDSGLLKKIIEAIDSRDAEAFEKYFDSIVEKIQTSSGNAVSVLCSSFISISSHLLTQAYKYNFTNLFSGEDIERMTNLYKHKNLDEMRSFLVDMLRQLITMTDHYLADPADTAIEQVKAYISDHMEEDLSLNVLAAKVYMNPSYLSRIFSQKTHEQLVNYIRRQKVEHASVLLMNNDLKIYEISQKLGFENPNYFAKVFRKISGISPQEFRTLNITSKE